MVNNPAYGALDNLAIAAAVLYTGGPKPYGYLGLGEVFVFVFFGLVAVLGTTYVQTGDIPAMWLRDSSAQVRPYVPLARHDPDLQSLLAGLDIFNTHVHLDQQAVQDLACGEIVIHHQHLEARKPGTGRRRCPLARLFTHRFGLDHGQPQIKRKVGTFSQRTGEREFAATVGVVGEELADHGNDPVLREQPVELGAGGGVRHRYSH